MPFFLKKKKRGRIANGNFTATNAHIPTENAHIPTDNVFDSFTSL